MVKKNRKYNFICEKPENIEMSSELRISTVTSLVEFKDFFNVHWVVYKDDKNWVPPFWKELRDFFNEKNPFWSHAEAKLFIIYKNNKIVGRIAAIIDHLYCEISKEKIGFFGYFECIEDFHCAKALFESAENWLISKEMKIIRGPIDGRIDIKCGFLYNGFDTQPSLLSPYSPSYYIKFVEKFRMKKIRDQNLYYIDLTKNIPQQLKEKAEKCVKSGVKIRRFSRLFKHKEMKWWTRLFLQTFSDHWGYVPVSINEIKSRFGVKQLRWIVDSRLFLIAELNGSPVAFLWSSPDYNQIFSKIKGKLNIFIYFYIFLNKNKIKKGKLHFIGIKKEFRNLNIGSCLNYKTLVEMKKRGYIGAEVAIDEGNTIAQKTIALTEAEIYKKFRVYEKKLHRT